MNSITSPTLILHKRQKLSYFCPSHLADRHPVVKYFHKRSNSIATKLQNIKIWRISTGAFSLCCMLNAFFLLWDEPVIIDCFKHDVRTRKNSFHILIFSLSSVWKGKGNFPFVLPEWWTFFWRFTLKNHLNKLLLQLRQDDLMSINLSRSRRTKTTRQEQNYLFQVQI